MASLVRRRVPNQVMMLVIAAVLVCSSAFARAEECPAPKEWFSTSGVPLPSDAEPRRGADCDFYQRAWQNFLYATDGAQEAPRFTTYKSYNDEFGTDRLAGLLASPEAQSPSKRLMTLAPRLMKAAHSTEAQDILQAGSSAILIDQNGHPIFYNIFLNPTFSNIIDTRHYNDLATLKSVKPDEELPTGVVEFKAAWQIVDRDHPPEDRIVLQAQVPWLIADPNKPGKLRVDRSRPLRTETVALIGLHVVFRPEGHPEMIWSTFEYERNAPSTVGNPSNPGPAAFCPNPSEVKDDTIADDGKPYVLYGHDTAITDVNQRPSAIAVVDSDKQVFSPRTSIARTFPFSGCFPGQNPSQAVKEVDPAIVALNNSARPQITKKWLSGYSLVGAVWLDEPQNPNDGLQFAEGQSFDDFQLGGEDRLSSTSMESFTQIGSPNCFSCHDTNSKGTLGPKRISVSHVFRRFSLDQH
jgi:hypothetical protein